MSSGRKLVDGGGLAGCVVVADECPVRLADSGAVHVFASVLAAEGPVLVEDLLGDAPVVRENGPEKRDSIDFWF
jgi:hypothetical protein